MEEWRGESERREGGEGQRQEEGRERVRGGREGGEGATRRERREGEEEGRGGWPETIK